MFVAFKDITVKKILEHNHALPFSFLYTFGSTIGMLVFYNKITFVIPLYVLGLIMVKSSILAIAIVLIFKAIKHLEISVVAPLTNLSPAFLVILSYFLLNERISYFNLLGIVLLIFIGYALELNSFYKLTHPFKFLKNKYFGYIMITLILWSFSAIFDKYLIQFLNIYTFIFYMLLFITIILLFYLMFINQLEDIQIVWKKSRNYALLAIVFSLIADLTYFSAVAIPGTLITLIIPLKRLSTFFTVLIGGKIFHENHLFYKSIITVIMIIGIYMILT